jgi:hypothetical protein
MKNKFITSVLILVSLFLYLGFFVQNIEARCCLQRAGQTGSVGYCEKWGEGTACNGSGGGDPASESQKGYLDNADCNFLKGWTCDSDDYNAKIVVHFYKDGKAGQGGTYIGQTIANLPSGDIDASCGGKPGHRFQFPIPDSLRDGVNHKIYAHAINIPTDPMTNFDLPICCGAVNGVTCNLPTSTPTLKPKTWTIKAQPICTNGETSSLSPRVFYALWRVSTTDSLIWKYDTAAKGTHTVTIPGTVSGQAYFGMEYGTNEIALKPYGNPPYSAIEYGQWFVPQTDMANWDQTVLPSGTYPMKFEVPLEWCVPVATCTAGKYLTGSPAACQTCPAGKYCPLGITTPTICPANNYCPAGASAPTACPTGKTSPAGSDALADCTTANSPSLIINKPTANSNLVADGVTNNFVSWTVSNISSLESVMVFIQYSAPAEWINLDTVNVKYVSPGATSTTTKIAPEYANKKGRVLLYAFENINGGTARVASLAPMVEFNIVAGSAPAIPVTCVCKTDKFCHADCNPIYKLNSYISGSFPSIYPNPFALKCKANADCRRSYRTLGDANGDEKVNEFDYLYYLRVGIGVSVPTVINADFNGDGSVNTNDLKIFQYRNKFPNLPQ